MALVWAVLRSLTEQPEGTGKFTRMAKCVKFYPNRESLWKLSIAILTSVKARPI
jgi:hypothetical protein